MSRWFRHYAGMMRDEKLVATAVRSKQPVERVVWVWGAILESAAEINDGGRFSVDTAEFAYFLRADQADVDSIIACLGQLERISEGRVAAWGKRQFKSDESAERVAAYRKRKDDGNDQAGKRVVTGETSNGDVTECNGDVTECNAPETETKLETERKKVQTSAGEPARRQRSAYSERFQEFWQERPRRLGDDPRKPAEKKFSALVKSGTDPEEIIRGAKLAAKAAREQGIFGTKFVPQAVKWLNDQRFADHGSTDDEPKFEAKGFYASEDSEQLAAWDQHSLAIAGKRLPRDRQFGWRVPSEWPPGYVPPDQHDAQIQQAAE